MRVFLIVVAAVVTACGGSVDNTPGKEGSVPGEGAGGASAGTGGASSGGASTGMGGASAGAGGASAGTGGASADGNGLSTPPEPAGGCGSSSCDSWRNELLASCCTSEGTCGWLVSLQVPSITGLYRNCQPFGQEGHIDPACGEVAIYFSQAFQKIASFPGCCRPDGRCGAVIHTSSGCVAREEIDGTTSTCTP